MSRNGQPWICQAFGAPARQGPEHSCRRRKSRLPAAGSSGWRARLQVAAAGSQPCACKWRPRGSSRPRGWRVCSQTTPHSCAQAGASRSAKARTQSLLEIVRAEPAGRRSEPAGRRRISIGSGPAGHKPIRAFRSQPPRSDCNPTPDPSPMRRPGRTVRCAPTRRPLGLGPPARRRAPTGEEGTQPGPHWRRQAAKGANGRLAETRGHGVTARRSRAARSAGPRPLSLRV